MQRDVDAAMQRDMDAVVETLKNAKHRERGCSLLIGAGCSVKAGIPLASKFTEIIKERFPQSYKRAKEPSYPQCMSQLSLSERRDLIAEFVDQAKINWAHICIAQMMKHGYIDRVLTVNFDPLVVMACALLGIFPAVYDFAASQRFKPADIPDQSIFYLHGQRSGFVLLNTKKEVDELSKHLEPVFSDAGRGRVWLVVGYSGANDPVFEHLAQVERFDNRLYWVSYKDEEPPPHVSERLLVEGKDAFYVKGYDADDFFVTLAQKLNCFPPDLIGKPFSHLQQLITMMTPYSLPGEDSTMDVTANTMKYIREAIERYGETFQIDTPAETRGAEDAPREVSAEEISALSRKATELFMAGDYDAVIALKPEYDKTPTPEIADPIARAYAVQGNIFNEQARAKAGEEAEQLLNMAIENYKAALAIKPDYKEALNGWGFTLVIQGEFKTGEEAEKLFNLAIEKFKASLKLAPNYHTALNNWGFTLVQQAKMKSGEEAEQLLNMAIENYKAALAIKPDYKEALNGWGFTLILQAKMKSGEETEQLLNTAIEKFKHALKIKPDYDYVLKHWGLALYEQARIRSGEEADKLFALAYEKYEDATTIKPHYPEAFENWGIALAGQAKRKSGDEAEQLYSSAYEKFEAAIKVSPDYHSALGSWSDALAEQAKTKSGAEAERLLALAEEKREAARRIRPDLY